MDQLTGTSQAMLPGMVHEVYQQARCLLLMAKTCRAGWKCTWRLFETKGNDRL